MSYYRPSFSQTIAMTRGRGYSSSYRGNSRGWGGGRGGYSPRGSGSGRLSSFSFDSRSKYSGSGDRFNSRLHDDYRKSYRPESSYSGRDSGHRSPDRKRMRTEAPSSRHDSSYGGYGSSRYESSYSDRRSFGSERHSAPMSRRDDFRRPSGPPPRGGYRGRLSSRGSRGFKLRDRPTRRRLLETSYAVRKRVIAARSSDYARRLKISRMRSAIARRTKKRPVDDDKEDSDEKDEKEETPKDSEAKEEEDDGKEQESEKSPTKGQKEEGSVKDDKSEASGDDKLPKKAFIKLHCPHCPIRSKTFRQYDYHLQGRTHLLAMRRIAIKQKSILSQMRQAQRNTQNELEKTSDDLTARTNFCPLCKLNYKQRKMVHQTSEAHKNMKKFLMPYCKVCHIAFKSPMIYESHCCTIEHIKRKQRVEDGHSEESGEEDNLENFTTIDSVGDVDESEDKKEDGKETINVGIEQIRKVEAHYCDLCKMYLSRGEETDMPKIIARHCKQRVHMQRYVRYKEDQDLEKRAEKLQRKETAEKEDKEKTEKGEPSAENDENPKDAKEAPKDDEEARDDKLWADVDKDLGDILAEAESGNKSSDEDEDDSHVNGERYDRFKLSEKNEEEKLKKVDGEAAEDSADVKEETAEEK